MKGSTSTPPRIAREKVLEALSSKHWKWSFPVGSVIPPTLVTLFEERLPHIAKCEWGERLQYGGAYVNGAMVFEDIPLSAPCWIEYFEPKFEITSAHEVYPQFSPDWILFEDEHLLIVYKPVGISVLPSREQRHFTVKEYLERYLRDTRGSTFGDTTTLHLPSRLDTATEGLLIASVATAMHPHLQHAFERRTIEKYYLLEVVYTPEWLERTVEDPIGKDKRHPILRRIDLRDGKAATTIFRLVGEGVYRDGDGSLLPTSLLEARLLTGRTHQIRVHAAYSFASIIGDRFYDGPPADSLHLMSSRIRFENPISQQTLDISVPSWMAPEWVRLSMWS